MKDPVFDEFDALVPHRADADWWERRDREVAELRAKENAGGELERMRRRASLLRDNGFPDESLYGALLTKPRETTALKHARQFSQMASTMLVLAGGVGVGKTTAAAWSALKHEDARPGFLRASELERRGRYDKKLDEWVKDKTSLVLDDLGAEVLDGKGVFVSLLDELIDRFYSARTILLLTTNLTSTSIAERYGARAASRIGQRACWGECGMCDLRREQLDLPTGGRA